MSAIMLLCWKLLGAKRGRGLSCYTVTSCSCSFLYWMNVLIISYKDSYRVPEMNSNKGSPSLFSYHGKPLHLEETLQLYCTSVRY